MVIVIAICRYSVTSVWKQGNIGNHHVLECKKKKIVMSNKEQENRDYDKQIEEDYYKYWELIDYDD